MRIAIMTATTGTDSSFHDFNCKKNIYKYCFAIKMISVRGHPVPHLKLHSILSPPTPSTLNEVHSASLSLIHHSVTCPITPYLVPYPLFIFTYLICHFHLYCFSHFAYSVFSHYSFIFSFHFLFIISNTSEPKLSRLKYLVIVSPIN
jgi:hypothetical protein